LANRPIHWCVKGLIKIITPSQEAVTIELKEADNRGKRSCMAKAINWPGQFRNEVIEESTDQCFVAFRLGRLYYDHHYWVDGEIIDLRVNHKIIRKAVIVGEMKCCAIQDLTDEDFTAQKTGIKTHEQTVQFLAETYEKEVTPSSEITVVYYKNLPVDPEIMEVEDDPHMG
jgi:hypothetical protein